MEWLAARTNDGRDPLTTEELKEFTFDGERFLLMDPQRGIRKPAAVSYTHLTLPTNREV